MIETAVADPADPRIADYRRVRDAEWIRERGLFVAESRRLVRRLIEGRRFTIRSLLVSEAARRDLDAALSEADVDAPCYVATREVISGVAGFHVHQGCLALAECGPALDPLALAASAKSGRGLLVVAEGLSDPDNVGGLFRNAQGFGADGVWIAGGGAGPLYRKALRVSMGAALELPFAEPAWPDGLAALAGIGFTTIAAVAEPDATPLPALDVDPRHTPVALCFGHESSGLSDDARRACSVAVTIPTRPGFDSLNVASASAVLLHHFHRVPGA